MHLVCGEALFDVFAEAGAFDDEGTCRMLAVPGGSPFNVAVGLSRLGRRSALATDIARDELGRRLAAKLASEHVADTFISRSAAHTALAMVTLNENGTPSYSFRGLGEAKFAPGAVSLDRLSAVRNLHLGSIALVLPNSADPLLSLARACSPTKLVSLDPNVRLAVEPDRSVWRHAIDRIRPLAHVVKVSEEDIACAYGGDVDAHSLCSQWLDAATELVVLTCGGDGARIFTRASAPVHLPAVAAPIVDTVGAGDSFMAALLAHLAAHDQLSASGVRGHDRQALHKLGRYAASAAALSCSRRGPALPDSVEVDRVAAKGCISA